MVGLAAGKSKRYVLAECVMIRLREVQFSYRPGERVLDDVSLDIGPGLTLLLGPNGSGKSTLLKIVAGVERPDLGSAEIEGLDLWKNEVAARRKLAYISEQPDLTPYATIRDVMDLVCRLRAQPLQRGIDALARAGLAPMSARSIRELSMGQRRRAVLAAAWVGTPRVVILDEPLEAMDRAIRGEILLWIDGLLASAAAVVVATHQIEPFVGKAARAIGMRDGECRLSEPLPADPLGRLAALESLSRP
jgi:ABC-type multidrug transport system ATPase subunit